MPEAVEQAGLVARVGLLDRLSGPAAVALVCAPAGSGKTVLLRSWLQETELPAAWISVERGERDAQRFWLSLIDALAGAVPVVERADPAPSFSGEALVDRLLADLTLLDEPAVLVIDDLHELDSAEALRWLEVLLARLPAALRVVLATREEPRLGLHSLRLAGQLTEIRAADLRFSEAEARQLLQAAGVRLSDQGAARLYALTEGWAAGLRLAAISLARHPDPERFVAEFSGSERTVAGYLVTEVLERQPAPVRELLLRTSLLERVSGPLADHLTGGSGSERILLGLEEANAFVTALDGRRTWFRYHHLFADLLQLELRRTHPELMRDLHRAASSWFQRDGDVVAAIRHAQAAGDWAAAGRQLAESRIGLILDGRMATVRALLDAFPPGLGTAEPELAVCLAGLRLREGALDEADAYVAAAERLAPGRPGSFAVQLGSVRLASAQQRGDLPGALDAMRELEAALAAQPPADVPRTNDVRALALMTLGSTELWALKLGEARRHLEDGLALARRIRRPYLEIACLAHLAIAAPLTGQTAMVALDHTRQAVALAEEHGLSSDPVAALAYAVGGGSLTFLGRFAEAEQWLDKAEQALRHQDDPSTELALLHARGVLRTGKGRFAEALAALRRAQEVNARLAGDHALAVDLRLRCVLAQLRLGETAAARACLAGLSEAERHRAETRIAAGAVALAEGDPEGALERLAPVIERSVPSLVPTWAAVHALLYDALARELLGDARGADAVLERALELAEPEGLLLPFAVAPVGELLRRHGPLRTAHPTLVTTILDVLAGASAPEPVGPLREPLSDAELRVVRFLPSNLKASEIAAELFVSTNTVRTHLRHIYAKLDAHGRAEAVARARELRLLAPR
jgi:LuxR family transcriptional regulator, maltose regulon positive regulatory protein